jgi:pyruvate dehydrogenase E2 component (dihydrolipoamide acetyltransferase)
LAAEKGVDISQIRGTGPNGRIHVRDVEDFLKNPHSPTRAPVAPPSVSGATPQASAPVAAAARPAAPALPAIRASGSKEVIPLTKMRQVIAQRLQLSKQTVPHFYTTIDVDMEAAMALRERVNQQLEKEKLKISVNDLVMKAVAMALVRHPEMNAHFKEKENEIHRFADVNLGVAVALPDGLIVPVLRGVQHMGLREIKIRTADLVERAKSQRLKGDEMTGGTFTISNLGAWGVKDFGAIVNTPEIGILAVGAAEQRAVVYKGQLAARYTMSLTLSGDHRAVDGATAAEFCRTLKGMLEEPGMMLV